MIAIDIPMPESCKECLFRDCLDECRLQGRIRPHGFTRDPYCPLRRVEVIKARVLAPDNNQVRIEIGRKIGEGLAEKKAIEFHTVIREVNRCLNPEGERFFRNELIGEMPVIMPKGV